MDTLLVPADTDTTSTTPDATETVKGKAEIATQPETEAGSDDTRFITPLKLKDEITRRVTPDASETVKGKAEIADQTETNAGTDDTRFITPKKLKDSPLSVSATNVDTVGAVMNTDTSTAEMQFVKDEDDMGGLTPSDIHVPTQQSVKQFVTDQISNGSTPDATTTVKGKAELATQAEVDAGTGTNTIVTPETLAINTKTPAGALVGTEEVLINSSGLKKTTAQDIADLATVPAIPVHTGEVTGGTNLTLHSTAISNKDTVVGMTGTEEVLVNTAGTLEKVTVQDIIDTVPNSDVLSQLSSGAIIPTHQEYSSQNVLSTVRSHASLGTHYLPPANTNFVFDTVGGLGIGWDNTNGHYLVRADNVELVISGLIAKGLTSPTGNFYIAVNAGEVNEQLVGPLTEGDNNTIEVNHKFEANTLKANDKVSIICDSNVRLYWMGIGIAESANYTPLSYSTAIGGNGATTNNDDAIYFGTTSISDPVWTGTSYIVQNNDAFIIVEGQVEWASAQIGRVDFYVNGTRDSSMTIDVSSTLKPFKGVIGGINGALVAGDVITISHSFNGLTTTVGTANHFLTIREVDFNEVLEPTVNLSMENAYIKSPELLEPRMDTQANLDYYVTLASTTNGQLCYATDTKKLYTVLDNALLELTTGAGVSSIDDLSDVDTTTSPPTTNEVLAWDGNDWVPASGGGTVTPWIVYTPVWTNGGGGAQPSLGNGKAECYWRRVEDSIEVKFSMEFGSTTTFGDTGGWWLFSIPSGLNIDLAKQASYFAFEGGAFYADLSDRNNNEYGTILLNYNATQFALSTLVNYTLTPLLPFTWAPNDTISCRFTVPIVEFA